MEKTVGKMLLRLAFQLLDINLVLSGDCEVPSKPRQFYPSYLYCTWEKQGPSIFPGTPSTLLLWTSARQ